MYPQYNTSPSYVRDVVLYNAGFFDGLHRYSQQQDEISYNAGYIDGHNAFTHHNHPLQVLLTYKGKRICWI